MINQQITIVIFFIRTIHIVHWTNNDGQAPHELKAPRPSESPTFNP